MMRQLRHRRDKERDGDREVKMRTEEEGGDGNEQQTDGKAGKGDERTRWKRGGLENEVWTGNM